MIVTSFEQSIFCHSDSTMRIRLYYFILLSSTIYILSLFNLIIKHLNDCDKCI